MKKKKGKKMVPKIKLTYKATPIEQVRLDETETTVKFLRQIFDKDTFLLQEESIAILMNGHYLPIGFLKLGKGGKDMVAFDTKSILQAVLISGADSFIIAHNHPNGVKYPSDQDLDLSFTLIRQANMMDIDYIDNIILTHDNHFSMNENSLLWELH